jgi:hypothetical protein
LRPLKESDLESAFAEREFSDKCKIEKIHKLLADYKKDGTVPAALRSFLGTERPSPADVAQYCEAAIEQIKSVNLKKMYYVYVDLGFKSDKTLTFHKSLNPKVTFGYSGALHEECFCEITEELKDRLLPSFVLDDTTKFREEYYSCGAFRYGEKENCMDYIEYEDLAVLKGKRVILSTISHESIFNLFFNETDIAEFYGFEGETRRNKKIIEKMQE